MALYDITTPDGKTVTIEGDTPPTDADLDYLFSAEGMADRSAERAAEGAQARTRLRPGEETAGRGAIRRSYPDPSMPEYYAGTGLSPEAAANEAGKFAGDVEAAPYAAAGMALPLIIPTTKAALVGSAIGAGTGYGVEKVSRSVGLPEGVSRALGIGAGLLSGGKGLVTGFKTPLRQLPQAAKEAFESVVGYLPRVAGRGLRRGLSESADDAGANVAHTAALREQAKRELGMDQMHAAAIREGGKRESLAATAARRQTAQKVVAPPAAAPVVPAAAPATASKSEAAAQLEALLGQALKEGQLAAATREGARGNRQLAEKILKGIR